jgi:ferredoxin
MWISYLFVDQDESKPRWETVRLWIKKRLRLPSFKKTRAPRDEEMKLLQRLRAPVRQLLVDNGINAYQSVTRWTTRKGKQPCGTCIVNVKGGAMNTEPQSIDEGLTHCEKIPTRTDCRVSRSAYGDVTVETFLPSTRSVDALI